MERHNRVQRLITKQELEQIYQKYKKIKIISKILDIDKDTLSKFLILYGIKKYKPSKKILNINHKIFIKDYEKLGTTGVAKKYKMHHITINKLLKYLNIEINNTYTLNENFFNQVTSEVFYIAGFIAADGCIYKQPNATKPSVLSISLSTKDKNHLEKMKILMEYNGPIHDSITNKIYKKSSLQIGSKRICESLKMFGIEERKSQNYQMPEWLLNHPLVNYFLLGYFDGDGSIYKNKHLYGCISICGSFEFLNQLNYILYKNKIVNKEHKKLSKKNNIYYISYNGTPISCKIYKFMYQNSTIFLDRKYKKYLELK